MAKYNIHYRTILSSYNIWEITEDQLEKVILAYKQGETKFTLSGKQYHFNGLREISIFTSDRTTARNNQILDTIVNMTPATYLSKQELLSLGIDVTAEKLGDSEYGCEKQLVSETNVKQPFINEDRIKQLSEIKSEKYDLSKLIALCNEINSGYNSENYYSVLMLIRAILDHVPPIFDKTSFNEVANNCGTKSFKDAMRHLNESSRKIADGYLHQHIRRSESTPTETQVNYSQDVDFLLGEIVRILK